MIRTRNILALLLLPLLLAGCTSSASVDIEGPYLGTISGSFLASMEFTVSGNTISGTAEIIEQAHMPWFRGTPDTTHIIISGTRSKQNITSMTGVTNMQFRPSVEDDWVDISLTMNMFGAFNNKGGVNNTSWNSDWQIPNQTTYANGNWTAVRVSGTGSAGGVLRP